MGRNKKLALENGTFVAHVRQICVAGVAILQCSASSSRDFLNRRT
jgi:hypothetical protein